MNRNSDKAHALWMAGLLLPATLVAPACRLDAGTPPDVDPLAARQEAVPPPSRIVPMPGVEVVPMPHPGGRTDTRTAMAGDGHLYVAGGGYLWDSADGGRTWKFIELPAHLDVAGGFGILADDTFASICNHDGSSSAVVRSTDRGLTWGEPVPLAMDPYNYAGGWPQAYLHPDGTAMMAITLRNTDVFMDYEDPRSALNAHIFRSTDGGRTWGDRTLLYRFGAEPSVLALRGSDRMLAFIRAQRTRLPGDTDGFVKRLGGPPRNPWVCKNGVLIESEDRGRTWTRPRLFSGYGGVPGELIQGPDGRVAAIWLLRYPHDKAQIRVRLSRDAGRTWDDTVYVLMHGHGYPSSVVRDDGTIVTVCEDTRMTPAGQPVGERTMAAALWRLPGGDDQ